MIYLQLFLSFLKIGLFGFGGGLAISSLIQHEVESHGWMTQEQFVDILAISQVTPGPIGINCATYVGYTATGTIWGSILATIAIVLPSLVIMLGICRAYFYIRSHFQSNIYFTRSMRMLRFAVLGLIAAAVLSLITPVTFIDWTSWAIFAGICILSLLPQIFKTQQSHTKKHIFLLHKLLQLLSHPILLIILAGCVGYCIYSPKNTEEVTLPHEQDISTQIDKQIDSVLARMTTREKIAQLIIIHTDSYSSSSKYKEQNNALISEEGIGGVLILQDHLPRFIARMNELQSMAKIPLLVSIDGEWGPSMRFAEFPFFPQQMQLGALQDDSLIYEMGKAVAQQCQMANIHINFAPVVDINNNPQNPVINTRSFGENREKVTTFANAYMRGMQDAGIIACSKHFPGHGDTDVDSHKSLPTLPFDRTRLDSIELYPFRSQIQQGVKMIMIGHLLVPALDKETSSLSYPIVTGLLREELGFDGLIVSDALMMKGVSANLPPEEVTLAAYKAGIELLLNPGKVQKSIDRIQRAIESGECSIEELDRRVRKVLHTKAEFGMLDSNYVCTIDTNNICLKVRRAEHIALSQKLSEKSMTLLSNTQQIIPLTTNKRVAYIAYNAKHIPLSREYGDIKGLSGYNPTTGMVDSTTLLYQHLLKTLSTTTQVHYFTLDQNSTTEEIKQLNQQLSNYDVAILACHEPNGRSKKHLLTSQHKYALRSIVRKHHPILVHFGNPYGLSSLPWLNELGAILVAYQDSENNQIAAAKVLTGEIIAEGELPVGI